MDVTQQAVGQFNTSRHGRARDPDGGEFTDLNEAEAEAAQSARDLMAAELKRGNPVPSSWRMLVATQDDTVLKFLPFSVVASGTSEISERQLIEPVFATRLFNKNKTVEPPAADVTNIERSASKLELSCVSRLLIFARPSTKAWERSRKLAKRSFAQMNCSWPPPRNG